MFHCVKSVRIRSYSGSYFPAFGLRISPHSVQMRENTDQNNSEHGRFSRSVRKLESFRQWNNWKEPFPGLLGLTQKMNIHFWSNIVTTHAQYKFYDYHKKTFCILLWFVPLWLIYPQLFIIRFGGLVTPQ